MRIGLGAGATTIDRIIEQAVEAEAAGFTSLWFPSAVLGDPLAAIAVAGRATSSIELGTAVLVTYAAHPVLTAARVAATAATMARPGLVLGMGPSHDMAVERMYGLSYAHVGRHTEEYTRVVTAALRGEDVERRRRRLPGAREQPAGRAVPGSGAPRRARTAHVAGRGRGRRRDDHLDGEPRGARRPTSCRGSAPRPKRPGRPEPRIVVGLPVAVHDDVDEARADADRQYGFYGTLPNYQRILAHGGLERSADACIVGDEDAVAAQLAALVEAGATDVWAAIFPVGDDRKAPALGPERCSRDWCARAIERLWPRARRSE